MSTYRIAVVTAIATCVLWAAKATAIGLAGGLDRSPLESPLFLAGLVCCCIAVVSLGLHLTRERPGWQRGVAAIGLVAATVAAVPLLVALVDAAVAPDPGRHWAWYELNLWVVAAAVLVATVAARTRTAPLARGARRSPAVSAGQ